MQVYEMLQSSLWLLHTCCLMFFLTLVVFQKSFKRWMLVSQLCKPQLTLSASTRTLLGLTWLRQQLPKCLINYSWGSTAVRVWCNFCKWLHDALKLQKRVELGSVTLEQSLLLGLNLSGMKLRSCCSVSSSSFLVYFPASTFACWELLTIYPAQWNCTNPCVGSECKIFQGSNRFLWLLHVVLLADTKR